MKEKAFPHIYDTQGGMTLRDYFAAKVFAAWISKDVVKYVMEEQRESFDGALTVVASTSYLAADAMLKAREQ